MSDTRKLIDFAAEDNGVSFRDALYSAIHDRVTAHIEAKKQEVAQNLITRNESVDLTEGKMDKASLSSLWHKHADHSYKADQGYGLGHGSMEHNERAATAIENHVRKHYGNKVADDMVSHSDHHVAHAEYAGVHDAPHHEKEMQKLRSKHGITGGHHGMSESVELEEGKMDDLEDARREKAEKKASEYKFGPKPKKTLATIRKVAGHSDSGAKRDDKEKDED